MWTLWIEIFAKFRKISRNVSDILRKFRIANKRIHPIGSPDSTYLVSRFEEGYLEILYVSSFVRHRDPKINKNTKFFHITFENTVRTFYRTFKGIVSRDSVPTETIGV
jgi:hypothetical protein